MTDRRNAEMKELVTDSSNTLQDMTEFRGFGHKHHHSVNIAQHIPNICFAVFFLTISAFSAAPTVRALL